MAEQIAGEGVSGAVYVGRQGRTQALQVFLRSVDGSVGPAGGIGGYEHGVEGTKCRECWASGEGVFGAVCRAAREWEPASCHGWRSCGRCGDNSQAEVGCENGRWWKSVAEEIAGSLGGRVRAWC